MAMHPNNVMTLKQALSEVWDSALKYNHDEETPDWFDGWQGICENVIAYIISCRYRGYTNKEVETDLKGLFKGWPEHSGDDSYPVPAPKGLNKTAEEAYLGFNRYVRWSLDTEYGKSRMSLLEYAMLQLVPNTRVDEE